MKTGMRKARRKRKLTKWLERRRHEKGGTGQSDSGSRASKASSSRTT